MTQYDKGEGGKGAKQIFWLFLRFLSGEGIPLEAFTKEPEPWTRAFAFHRLWGWPQYLAERGWIVPHPRFATWHRWAERVSERFSQELSQILEVFHREGIATQVLKGGVTRTTLYPEPPLRLPVDIDLYIHREERERAGKLLLSLGYLPATETPPEENFEWVWEHPERYPVELHWDLHLPHRQTYSLPPPGAFTEKDHFLHSLLHFAQHKGELRFDQEADLLLYLLKGIHQGIGGELAPILYLLGKRCSSYHGLKIPELQELPLSWVRRMGLAVLYRARKGSPLSPLPGLRRALMTVLLLKDLSALKEEILYQARKRGKAFRAPA